MNENISEYIDKCIEKNAINLFFQPQYCYENSNINIIGVEVLIRPDPKICHIDRLIKIATQTKKISDFGYVIFDKALSILSEWIDKKYVSSSFTMSINISGAQLKDKHFVSKISSIIEKYDIEYHQIILEITESSIVDDINVAKLYQLSKKGIKISIDDFGTGYSSLSRLKFLPINEIKIDKIFVDDITRTDQDKALITAIFQLTKALNKFVIVEGIEKHSQLDILRDIGFTCFQGFLFSEPENKDEVISTIKLINSLHF